MPGPDSPVDGAFAAAPRPLRDSSIPLGSQMDRLLTALLNNAVSIRVHGRLGEPVTQVVPFGDVSSTLERVFDSTSP